MVSLNTGSQGGPNNVLESASVGGNQVSLNDYQTRLFARALYMLRVHLTQFSSHFESRILGCMNCAHTTAFLCKILRFATLNGLLAWW